MSYPLAYSLLFLRFISPPIIFNYVHPFYAMIIDETVIDGLLAPHHLFKNYVPKGFTDTKTRKLQHDIPLDAWGFMLGMTPVICKEHKYYKVFDGYRELITSLFIWRMIGFIMVFITRNMRVLTLFPNFYLPVYTVVAGCSLFRITDKKKIIVLIGVSMVLAYAREFYLMRNYSDIKLSYYVT